MRKRIWRRATAETTAGPAKPVSTVCIALSAGGRVVSASHSQGRWVRASPGDKLPVRDVGMQASVKPPAFH